MNWQPMETAPKDGTLILAVDRNAADVGWMYPYVMKWSAMHWQWNNGLEWKNWSEDGPKLWIPIPSIE